MNGNIHKHIIYVEVQFFPWFKFSFLFCFKLIIIHVHYHSPKQKEIKLNHNIHVYTDNTCNCTCRVHTCLNESKSCSCSSSKSNNALAIGLSNVSSRLGSGLMTYSRILKPKLQKSKLSHNLSNHLQLRTVGTMGACKAVIH